MSFVPVTPVEQAEMLATIGLTKIEALFQHIPESLRATSWDVPPGQSEMAVRARLAQLAGHGDGTRICFLGGGYYDHFVPAAVDALASRGEFATAYTPYQPEAAQGTLQSIYEYQSAVCRLTGMDFANASLYDGGTAVFEAATMAVRLTRRQHIVCHDSLNPLYREILETHTANLGLELLDGDDPAGAACVIVQNPAFLGDVRDFAPLAQRCHEAGALLIMSFYPLSLGLLKTPGAMGADIAVAEGQSLGVPLSFGGPYLGILTTRKEHVRRMPGRLAAATEDAQGRRGFVLTLQAREQHIRREKAMSNICSNEALIALRALIYLCLLGKEGLREAAAHCHAKAEFLKRRLSFARLLNPGPTFNEFAIRLPRKAQEVCAALAEQGYLAGLPLSAVGRGEETDLLVAVTEQRTRAQLDAFAEALARACR
ncbi:MAG: aminomethyl-transferring glycine dehydrogenase subunit GcvPA [Candidatus Hydrogenedentes bacterium]|jgi:glycine dehydrogenase subunit 1|nr:aminomethyl-transferring glycine dehydrogenase subunit GcvPA [Candidatus Hydrogenedentota bacterium]MDY0033686.1 aminomethyl-transferring glycine dehydrogenase subunit GcvPA [FCB group bacterium]NLT60269.1 aminomethyl-transferring glycine dehydrogenase subunit GcvPA [Candidatus Hydrogenedentota bacterium]HNZ17415.1 aminomethyl-transferring glycine dehydrogenase subunit GcvPA [Candidatus Hydrogenedentota bacterium]HOH33221.1 aminomethyl-transferring glycine dehydrogenase subunit GcvPA [Candid